MNFSYYPYGNARQKQKPDGTWEFTCQHGANECKANMMFACTMHYHSDPKDYWPFVSCVEEASSPATAGEKCAKSAGFDWSEINTCLTGKLGNQLEHAVGVATDGLVPRHQWTPWVVMNGKPLSQSQLDQKLVKLVCDAYQGSQKPQACTKTSSTVCMRE